MCDDFREIRGNRLTARSVSRERGQSGERQGAGVSMRMEDITGLTGDTVEVSSSPVICIQQRMKSYMKLQPEMSQAGLRITNYTFFVSRMWRRRRRRRRPPLRGAGGPPGTWGRGTRGWTVTHPGERSRMSEKMEMFQ